MGILKSAANPWASAAASVILHGVGLVALAGLAFSPASAPPLARGKGGSSIDVSIHWKDEGRVPEPAPVPPPARPPETATPPTGAPPPTPEPEPEAAIDHRTLSGDLPSPPAAALPPAPAESEPPKPESIELPRTAIAPPPPISPPATEPPAEAPGAPGAEGPAVEDAGALRPVYPLGCRRAGHEGTAIVRVVIGEDGKPLRVEILRSAGCRDLDQAALDAARGARFRAARRWGRPVISAIEQPFRFVLRG